MERFHFWGVGYFLSILLTIAGVIPFSFSGLGVPILFFVLLARRHSLVWLLWGGLAGGLVLDVVSPVHIGSYAVFFMSMALLVTLIKWYLGHSFWGGDMLMIIGGTFLGLVVIEIFTSIGMRESFGAYTFQFLAPIWVSAVLGLFVFWGLKRSFRKFPEQSGSAYVV